MNDSSGDLTRSAQACVKAARLLTCAGMTPMTKQRLMAVYKRIPGAPRSESQQRATLEELGDLGLITSSLAEDIITFRPDMVMEHSSLHLTPDNADLTILADALAELGEFDLLQQFAHALAAAGKHQAALDINLALLAAPGAPLHRSWNLRRANTLRDTAVLLTILNKLPEALGNYVAAIEACTACRGPGIVESAIEAIYGKAHVLGLLDRNSDALKALDAVPGWQALAGSADVRFSVAKADCLRADLLAASGCFDEAYEVLITLDQESGDDPEIGAMTAAAVFRHAQCRERAQRMEEALACYDMILDVYGHAPTESTRRVIAQTIVKRAELLCSLQRISEAEATYRDAVNRYLPDAPSELRVILDSWGTPSTTTAEEDATAQSFRAMDIDAGWKPTSGIPIAVVAAAETNMRISGPREFRTLDSASFGWQALTSAPGWWLIRLLPRSEFWGYGLYCLWTHGQVIRLDGTRAPLQKMVDDGQVRITSSAAAWEWYRLRGICTLVKGCPRYNFVRVPVRDIHGHEVRTDIAQVCRAQQGWAIECWRQVDTRVESVTAMVNSVGEVVSELVTSHAPDAALAAEPMCMTPESTEDNTVSTMRLGFEFAADDPLSATILRRYRLLGFALVPVAFVLGMILVLWRLGRTAVIAPLLPGLLISRYTPSTLDVHAPVVQRLLVYLHGNDTRRLTIVMGWYALMTLLCAGAPPPFAQLAGIGIAVAYVHCTYVFVRNEAIRAKVFRRTARETQYLSRLHDFVGEYALCALLFLFVLPLLFNVLLGPLLRADPLLPATVTQSYRFTLHALLHEIPDGLAGMLPFLPSADEPASRVAQNVQTAVQYVFHLSTMTLLIDKLWAIRGLRSEAKERLHGSLEQAVALGSRATRPLLRIVRLAADPAQVQMALLALGLVGNAHDREQLRASSTPDLERMAGSERAIALALLGDDATVLHDEHIVLPPSRHGGDDPLDFTILATALRAVEPSSIAVPSLHRILGWQGVSQPLRQDTMHALLRIPGAFSATDAIAWTKEFIGASIITAKHTEILDMFGRASVGLPPVDLARALGREWRDVALSDIPALMKYQAVTIKYRLLERGFDGYTMALQLAFSHELKNLDPGRQRSSWPVLGLARRQLGKLKAFVRISAFMFCLHEGKKDFVAAGT